MKKPYDLQGDHIIRAGLILFWSIFWLLNVLDKGIGGKFTAWVGKDFYALFIRFFSSIGLTDPAYATVALWVTAALEITALIFCVGSLSYFLQNKRTEAKTWFFLGSITGLVIFTFFAIGDQVFGDTSQLLEHSLFWLTIIVSWGAYIWLSKEAKEPVSTIWTRYSKELTVTIMIIVGMGVLASIAIIDFSQREYATKTDTVTPTLVAEGVYKFDLPSLADHETWESSYEEFLNTHPDLRVTQVYEAPPAFRGKMTNSLVLYVFTEDMDHGH